MKKVLSILVVLVLLFSVSASAAVKSKTTSDLTSVKAITAADGTDVTSAAYVTVGADTIMALDELDKIIDAVNTQKIAPVDYFPADVQAAILAAVNAQYPEVTAADLKTWTLDEFVSLGVPAGYTADVGDLTVNLEVATPYAADQKTVGVVGTFDGTRTEVTPGNYEFNVAWTPVQAKVAGTTATGSEVAVDFPADTLVAMQSGVANVLAIMAEAK